MCYESQMIFLLFAVLDIHVASVKLPTIQYDFHSIVFDSPKTLLVFCPGERRRRDVTNSLEILHQWRKAKISGCVVCECGLFASIVLTAGSEFEWVLKIPGSFKEIKRNL